MHNPYSSDDIIQLNAEQTFLVTSKIPFKSKIETEIILMIIS